MRPRLRILEPLGVRDFAVYWAGMTVSLVGDGFFLVAIAWQVYDLWNAPVALSIVGVAETVPLLALVLFGGVLADRLDRRTILVVAMLVRGAAVGVLGWLALMGALELWHVAAVAVVYGAGQAFAGPASGALVPDLVPPHLLVQANSMAQVVRPVAFRLVGPAVGGLVVHELGPGAAFVVDAATFAVVSGALLLLAPRTPLRTGQPTSVLADLREGLRFVRAHVWLWGTLAWAFVAFLVVEGPFHVLVPYVVRNELGGSASDLGLVFAAGGVGAVVASLVIGQMGLPPRHVTLMYAAWTFGMVDLVLYAIVGVPWHAMLIAFAAEACWTVGLIAWQTLLQRAVPAPLLGRVKSIDWLLSLGLVPFSYALTGPAAAWLGAETVMIGAGAVATLLTMAFYLLPGMRETERIGSPARIVLSAKAEPETA